MTRDPRSPIARYLLAVALTGLALTLRLPLAPVLGEGVPFILFYPALMLAVLFGGRGPGLLAAALSATAALYFFIPPAYSFRIADGQHAAQLVLFLVVGAFVSWLSGALRESGRRAEEASHRLAAIVESSEDAIVGKTLDGVVTSWNAGAERIYGWTAAEIVGRNVSTLAPPERATEIDSILERLRRGERVEQLETVRVRRDGTRFDAFVTVSPIKDATGRVVGASSIARDITESKAAERERERLLAAERAARADAERANSTKDEFLATLSHELRTPLTAVVGWAAMLRAGGLDPETHARAVETIERNARTQTQIIEDLLDVSRIITGKLRLDVRETDLRAVVENVLDGVRPAADAKGVQLRIADSSIADASIADCGLRIADSTETYETAASRPSDDGSVSHPGVNQSLQSAIRNPQSAIEASAIKVSGDAGRLQQVMWNLLSNAVKFTPRGGSVEVRLEERDGQARVTVGDTGQGIAPDFLPFVFERFRQADGSTSRAHGGLGLGLAIVRHLIELHGGTVRAESEGDGRGSTFTFELPLAGRPALAASDGDGDAGGVSGGDGRPDATRAQDAPALRGLRVLVVEDDPDMRMLVVAILGRFGAEVRAVETAAAGVGAVEEFRPDVLVSDLGLPGTDGFELIRNVRALAPARGGHTPALALTAYARAEDRARALREGFHLYLSKPVNPEELIAAVLELARQGRAAASGSASN